MAKGHIHTYTGDGKGKTTAAFGLAMRAAGHNKKVLILQFLKSGTKDSGEIISAKKNGIVVKKFKGQISPVFDPEIRLSDLKKSVKEAIAFSVNKIQSGRFDLVIMDEFNNIISNRYASISDLKKIIKAKPEGLELIFTGRGAPKELTKIADYITEMRLIRHPFKKGIKARRGIEF